MFNLLEDLHELPLDVSEIVAVSQGMNKVRVSVGQRVSEPSEVYIVTGRRKNRLETYVVFYMIQPEVLVCYGHKDNPYEESQREDVVNMAMDMVETMGSILQEVAWDGMSAHAREDWLADQKLLPLVEGEWEEVGQEEALEVEEPTESKEDATAARGADAATVAAPTEPPPGKVSGEAARVVEQVSGQPASPSVEEADDSDDPLRSVFLKPAARVASRRRIVAEPSPEIHERVPAGTEPPPVAKPPAVEVAKEASVKVKEDAPPKPLLAPPAEPAATVQATVSPPLPQVASIDVGPAAAPESEPPPAQAATADRDRRDRMVVLRFLSRI